MPRKSRKCFSGATEKCRTWYARRKLTKETSESAEPLKGTESAANENRNPDTPTRLAGDAPIPEASLCLLQFEDTDKENCTVIEQAHQSPSPRSSETQPGLFLVSPRSGILREVNATPQSSDSDGEILNLSSILECTSMVDSPNKGGKLRSSTPVPETPCTSTFKVAEITCTSGLLPLKNVSSPLEGTPRCNNRGQGESQLPPHESFFLDRVRVQLRRKLPPTWEANATEDIVIVRKNSSVDLRGCVQRCVLVSRDGTVELQMHFCPIRLDHQVWQELPDRVDLNSESVISFVSYVLKVVQEFRKYDICLGIPEKIYFVVAKKMAETVPDYNKFQESRYNFTYRSENCDLILQVPKKYCSLCVKIRATVKARFRRISLLTGSPAAKSKNSCLLTPQMKRKLTKLGRGKKNAVRRAKYYTDKIRVMIEKDGIDLDVNMHSDFKKILKRRWEKLSPLQRIFFEEQLKASCVAGKTGMRWHPVMIRLALQIHMVSPAAYDALYGTGIIHLPSARTLFNYSHHSVCKEGISRPAVRDLLSAISDCPVDHHSRYFMLLMDEMSISKNLVYSRASGELKGFVNISEVEKEAADLERDMSDLENILGPGWDKGLAEASKRKRQKKEIEDFHDVVPDIAEKMLTFMAVGITNGIKQVVASYGVTNPKPYALSSMMWDVVAKLEGNDANVLGLVCDGHPSNRAFIQTNIPITKLQSGVVFDTRNRVYPLRPFYFISDPPHLLKTIRNCFHNSECGKKTRVLKKEGEFISWRNSIVKLYNHEKDKEFRLAHKLNAQVVFLNPYSSMKVSYAARVFSASVANALRHLFPELKVTADFIERVNRFFDCLNGAAVMQAKHTRNQYLRPYRKPRWDEERQQYIEDSRFKYLEGFLKYILDWAEKEGGEDGRFCLSSQTVVGIEMTIRSFIDCVKFMLEKGAPFILARVFCQDPLEQYFGKQRASCGGSTNPNMAKFLSTQNKILNLKNLGFRRAKGNTKSKCSVDAATEARLCAPLLRRKRIDLAVKRINAIKRVMQS